MGFYVILKQKKRTFTFKQIIFSIKKSIKQQQLMKVKKMYSYEPIISTNIQILETDKDSKVSIKVAP